MLSQRKGSNSLSIKQKETLLAESLIRIKLNHLKHSQGEKKNSNKKKVTNKKKKTKKTKKKKRTQKKSLKLPYKRSKH